jgi:nicotinamide mononucleotide transporter
MTFSWLEIAGFITTLISVWLVIKEYRSGWLWSVLCALIYIIIYWEAKLYSDAELQLLYIAIGIYGYWTWNEKKNKTPLMIRVIGASLFALYVTITLIMATIWGTVHVLTTDASLPYADALLASTCIVAQWMMAKKYFQCWYLWIFANIGYILMYAVKGLPATTVLYIILFFITMYGYRQWKRTLAVALANK